MALSLPRDEVSVPLVRRITANALKVLGVDGECSDELQVALSEACANVLRHATDDDDYEVRVGLVGATVVIEVVDRGGGFDASSFGRGDAPVEAEQGRGIQLMRALVDEVKFATADGDGQGTRVSLTKHLEFGEGSPLATLAALERPERTSGAGVP